MFKIISQLINKYRTRKLIANIIVKNMSLSRMELSNLLNQSIDCEYISIIADIDTYNRIVYDVRVLYNSSFIWEFPFCDIFNVQIDKYGGRISYEIESGYRAEGLW